MQRRFAVVVGSNYSGSWQVYQSEQDARKFEALLRKVYSVPAEHIKTLYGQQYTRVNVIEALQWLTRQLSGSDCVGCVYVAGHGTQVVDVDGDETDGCDESWQTGDHRLLVDDEITQLLLCGDAHPDAHLVLITDACHSGTLLDRLENFQGKQTLRSWVSIGSAQDNESALQSGDGSVCTAELLPLLRAQPTITYDDLHKTLERRMKESFVGSLQTCRFCFGIESDANKSFLHFEKS